MRAEVEKQLSERIEVDSPAGIIVETLLNIQTVAALTMEERKFEEFKMSLEPNNHGNRYPPMYLMHEMPHLPSPDFSIATR